MAGCNLARSRLPLDPAAAIRILHSLHDEMTVRDEGNEKQWDATSECLAFCYLYVGVRQRVKGDSACLER